MALRLCFIDKYTYDTASDISEAFGGAMKQSLTESMSVGKRTICFTLPPLSMSCILISCFELSALTLPHFICLSFSAND